VKFIPHDYQQYAIQFLTEHPVAALLLDMGLGKTVTTLTAINELLFDRFEIRRVLVIAPLRVARDTWSAEIEKWEHLKHLKYSVAVGTSAERRQALHARTDICILNRENIRWLVEESGIPFDFDMLVIDELSGFKNHQTKRFKALMKVRPKVKRIVGLTGTPSSNGLMDLWAEFRLLDMGQRLGRFIGQYRTAYFQPDKRNGMVVYSYKPLPQAEKQIYDKISDITISMKAIDYLQMPELLMTESRVQLSKQEAERYKQLKQDLVLDLPEGEITATNAAALSNKLCQMSNGAIYDDENNMIPIHSRKLDALEDMIESANGKPVLVAYWFKHDRTRITERLRKLGVVYQEIKSAESIKNWNSGKLQVALIHPASAGHGLNLQAGGNFLVWFGLTWSLELYQQTNARLWRQGQQSETVVIQHIITKGTIDEHILKALQAKDETQTALMQAVKAEIGGSK
jgi:SNF2 family DNA or RNA helicase